MSFSEIDVEEVLLGFAPPPGMTVGSRIEAIRRLDLRATEQGKPIASRPLLAEFFGVSTRTIERYRRRLREATLS